MTIQLASLKFKAGATPEAEPVDMKFPTVLLAVGPNNCGKSQLLNEIYGFCHGQTPERIVERIEAELPSVWEDLLPEFEPVTVGYQESNRRLSIVSAQSDGGFREVRLEPSALTKKTARPVLEHLCFRVTRENLFTIGEPKVAGNLESSAERVNILQSLLLDLPMLEEIRKVVHEALSLYLCVSPLGLPNFKLVLSEVSPSGDELSLGGEARKFFSKAKNLASFGDGIKAFVSQVIAAKCFHYKVLLLDEPEAFLHPPLIRRLAREIVSAVSKKSAQAAIATHSSDFVSACLEESKNVGIVRLTYENFVPAVRVLHPSEIKPLVEDPVLRNSKVLDGLFYRAVVVTEGDSDRIFYEEINSRLSAAGRGVRDCLFVQSGSYAKLLRVVAPLRKLGIPAAAIGDLDMLKSSTDWEKLGNYDALDVPVSARGVLQPQLDRCKTILDAKIVKGTLFNEGLQPLSSGERNEVTGLIKQLAEHGLFIVPVGCLEQWLKALFAGSKSSKRKWVEDAFDRLGGDPSQQGYVQPGTDDVWKFMDDIESWCQAVLASK